MSKREILKERLDAQKRASQIEKDAQKQFKRIEKCREKLGLTETIERLNLVGGELEAARRRQAIDDKWAAVAPWSGKNVHSGERRMLYDILNADEYIERMVGGRFLKDTDRLHKHNGIAVATNKRVVFVDKGVFGSTEIMSIAYDSIESVTHSTGMFAAGVHVIGRGMSDYRIEDIFEKNSVQPFADCILAYLEQTRQTITPPIASQKSTSTVDELERLANLVERGFLDRAEFEAKKRELLQ